MLIEDRIAARYGTTEARNRLREIAELFLRNGTGITCRQESIGQRLLCAAGLSAHLRLRVGLPAVCGAQGHCCPKRGGKGGGKGVRLGFRLTAGRCSSDFQAGDGRTTRSTKQNLTPFSSFIGSLALTTLYGTNATSTWTMTGQGAGNVNGTFTFSGVTNLYGGTGTSSLIGPAGTNSWVLTGNNTGTLNGTLAFINMANLTGGSSNDTFAFQRNGNVTGTINGGGGSNTLDYTNFSTGVHVNLTAGTATNTGDVSNILVVLGSTTGNNLLTGGPGGSVLVGFGAGNQITGGAGGGNLLIGGTGGDTLTSGGSGDLMIAGTTAYDTNTTALLAILAEWQNTSESYTQRIDHLNGTTAGGLNGFYFLYSSTVQHATTADTLIGGTGSALDWFFAIAGRDTIDNEQSGETIS